MISIVTYYCPISMLMIKTNQKYLINHNSLQTILMIKLKTSTVIIYFSQIKHAFSFLPNWVLKVINFNK